MRSLARQVRSAMLRQFFGADEFEFKIWNDVLIIKLIKYEDRGSLGPSCDSLHERNKKHEMNPLNLSGSNEIF